MHRGRLLIVLPLLAAGCRSAATVEPSLAPRAAEAIDPRIPIPSGPEPGVADASLQSRLASLVAEARAGNAAFTAAADEAEQLAGSAGSAESEGWVAAQQALSAAVAARGQTVRALGDIDRIAASAIVNRGGIAPADLAAIQTAAAEAAEVDARQAERLEAIQARLGG